MITAPHAAILPMCDVSGLDVMRGVVVTVTIGLIPWMGQATRSPRRATFRPSVIRMPSPVITTAPCVQLSPTRVCDIDMD